MCLGLHQTDLAQQQQEDYTTGKHGKGGSCKNREIYLSQVYIMWLVDPVNPGDGLQTQL